MKLLTPKEYSKEFDIPLRTVYYRIKTGKLKTQIMLEKIAVIVD